MTDEELDDIVADLRDEDASAKASEGDYYADQFAYHGCGEAADAIEWLRAEVARLRLTDAEREAVRFSATAALPETEKLGGVAGELCRMHAATLRGLLERMA